MACTLGAERINGTKMTKTIIPITDSLAPAAKSELGQKENKCWEKAVTGYPEEGEGGGKDLSSSDEALVLITPTGKTQGYTASSKVGLGTERFGPQLVQDVLRCLAEQIVQFTLHSMSFFGIIANVIIAVYEHNVHSASRLAYYIRSQ